MTLGSVQPSSLFGTDGIRGLAGQFPLTKELTRKLGFSAGQVLLKKFPHEKIRVVGVRDTRESGAFLFDSLAEGLRECGIHVFDGGVLPTPSIAYLVHAHRCHSGFVISASHNPPEFNGIKFFNSHGRKWADEWEREVEFYFSEKSAKVRSSAIRGLRVCSSSWVQDYEDFLRSTLAKDQSFSGLRIAIDCSHGANSFVAPDMFRQLGADIFVLGATPSGKNINVKCGSQHVAALQLMVKRNKCHLGIAFDGDGDRVIFVDEKGHTIDGDYTLAILSQWFKKNKKLNKNTVVITVMANLGLKKSLHKNGIRTIETPVGDRHVSEAMKLHGAVLGGEQSGHIILGKHLPSGDGLLTALHVVSIIQSTGQSLSSLASKMKKFPQVLVNVPVKKKHPLNKVPAVTKLMRSIEQKLGSQGRVLVRYSGTEPLLRIMLEGPDKTTIQHMADSLVVAVHQNFN